MAERGFNPVVVRYTCPTTKANKRKAPDIFISGMPDMKIPIGFFIFKKMVYF